MAATGAGKTEHAALIAGDTNHFAFAEPLKTEAYKRGWNGVKDNAGRLLLETISREEKQKHGLDIFAQRTLRRCVFRLGRLKDVQSFVIIDDLRFGIEFLTLETWKHKSKYHHVIYVHIEDTTADERYKHDFYNFQEYAWSAPELEWRALVHLANIKHFNNRSIGIANDSNELKFAILKLISQLECENY